MKTLLLLISFTTFAGSPHQDLVVDVMRERFIAASPNLMEYDINLDKNWLCVNYNAREKIIPKFDVYKKLFNFKKISANVYKNQMNFPFKDFKFYEDGEFYSKNGSFYLFARKIKKDTLIFEYAGPQFKRNRSYRSISRLKLSGHSYIYCKAQE